MNVQCHAMYVCDIYRYMAYNVCMRYIYCEGMLACNVCMRYVCCKMANMQSETLIFKLTQKTSNLNISLGSPLEQ